jgi:hypothetical protein
MPDVLPGKTMVNITCTIGHRQVLSMASDHLAFQGRVSSMLFQGCLCPLGQTLTPFFLNALDLLFLFLRESASGHLLSI